MEAIEKKVNLNLELKRRTEQLEKKDTKEAEEE